MEIFTEQFKRCDVVTVTGCINTQTAPQLEATLEESLKAGRHTIVLNLSGLEFMSSAGLRVLMTVQKHCRHLSRGELILAAVPQRIYEAMDLAGLAPRLTLAEDVVQAVGSVGQKKSRMFFVRGPGCPRTKNTSLFFAWRFQKSPGVSPCSLW